MLKIEKQTTNSFAALLLLPDVVRIDAGVSSPSAEQDQLFSNSIKIGKNVTLLGLLRRLQFGR